MFQIYNNDCIGAGAITVAGLTALGSGTAILHPKYDPQFNNKDYNIALIRLATPATLSGKAVVFFSSNIIYYIVRILRE